MMKKFIKDFLTKAGNQFLKDSMRRDLDNAALLKLAPLIPSEFAWTEAAVAPRALIVLMNEIKIHRRQHVIECGSGVSTFVMARVLASQGGNIVSIDHDREWQELVKEMCHGLDNIEFIHAPLLKSSDKHIAEWYDERILKNNLSGKRFDMMFVDAPIGYKKANARYPALPVLKDYLAASFSIFLDDAWRSGERAISKKWAQEYDLNVRLLDVVADMALLFPKSEKARYVIT